MLLAERLRWLQEENTGEIDEEELESFLYAIAKGNVFNFQTILHLPVAVQNDTIDFLPKCSLGFGHRIQNG
ncbi:DnaJ-class chaperone [Escherichia coli]|uniref:DnaJ-class chaperone n=1 Tax=Escherichia coli TaxID=562 RepID=A0A376VQ06_ECOLX|nr:DnaJ-class chaperone [Escherichia coli]